MDETHYGPMPRYLVFHDDVIKWQHFPRYWPFVRGIHRSPVNSPHKGQWRGASIFSLICALTNGWVNNRDARDLRRHRPHYVLTVMAKWCLFLQRVIIHLWVPRTSGCCYRSMTSPTPTRTSREWAPPPTTTQLTWRARMVLGHVRPTPRPRIHSPTGSVRLPMTTCTMISMLHWLTSQGLVQIGEITTDDFNPACINLWWRNQMETFSALLALCSGNSPVSGEFPSQRPVTRHFDVFFDLRPNKQLNKQSRYRWFETPSRSLWRHCNK